MPRIPLQELPLEDFIPSDESKTSTGRPAKRPHSPAPSLNPAKRRILSEEGVLSSGRTYKSTLSSFASGDLESTPFHDFLRGSPRRLGFGSRKLNLEVTVKAELKEKSVLEKSASPFKATSYRKTRSSKKASDLSKLSRTSSGSSMASSSGSTVDVETYDTFSPKPYLVTPHWTNPSTPVPQATTPQDRQSKHHPGFFIHQDPHDYIPSPLLSPHPGLEADGADLESWSPGRLRTEMEKENLAPRRRSLKSDPLPLSASATDTLSFDENQAGNEQRDCTPSVPHTPHPPRIHDIGIDRDGSLTPTSLTPTSRDLLFFNRPGSAAHLTPKRAFVDTEVRMERRKELEDEIDGVEGF